MQPDENVSSIVVCALLLMTVLAELKVQQTASSVVDWQKM